jgi:hypothetical protein
MRIAGLVAALLLAVYGVVKYRNSGWGRGDLLLSLVLASGVGAVAVFPQVGSIFAWMFSLQNRAFALLAISNLVLFGLFLYLLGQVRAARRRSGHIVTALATREYTQKYAQSTSPKENGSSRILVIIPAYNEAGSICEVLEKIPDSLLGYEVKTVAVADGDTDGTERAVIEEGCSAAVHALNLGQGDALLTGFEISRIEDADIVVHLDADGQYKPEEMERLITPIIEDRADFVLGSRFYGYYQESGSIRHAGVIFFSKMISVLTGVKVSDCTNGFRAIRGPEAQKLELREDRFNATELLLEAISKKLRIEQVPVTMLTRTDGESKKPPKLAYPLGVLRVIVQTWLR